MTPWCKKLVLVLALTVMPLQGVAATLSVLLCHGEAQAHAMHDQGSHGHGAPAPHGGHQDKGGTTGDSAYHLCCNITASASSIMTLPASLPDFPVLAFAPDPLHDLFVPDRPQRPPLA